MSQKQINLISQLKDFGIAPVMGMIIGFFTAPITTRLLLPVEFGKASLFSLVQTFFQLLAVFGFDQAYVRFYNEEADKQKLLRTSIVLPFVVSFFAIIIALVFRKNISDFMFASYESVAIILLCLFFPSCLVYRFAMLGIRMELRGKLYSFITLLQQILNFVFLLGFLFLYEKTFRSVVYAGCLSSFVASVVSLVFSKNFSLHIAKIDFTLLKKMLLYGLPLIPSSLLVWVMNSFDKVALRNFSTFNEIGQYEAAFKIVVLVNIVKDVFTTTWVPIAFAWHSDSSVKEQRFDDVNVAICSGMSVIFAGIILFRNLILLLLGSEYRNTEQIFVFLLFTPILYTMSETSGLGIYFSKKTFLKLIFVILAALLNIIGNTILVPILGAVGAAMSTAFCYTVWFWCITLFSRKNWFKFRLDVYIVNLFIMLLFATNILIWKNRFAEIVIFCFSVAYNFIAFMKVFATQARSFLYSLAGLNIGHFRKIPKPVSALLCNFCNDSKTEFSLNIKTYDGSNQAVHPDFINFDNTLVFTCTPYPLGTDYYENPCIYYGDNIHDLKPIKHNPVAHSAINKPKCHLCDPNFLNYDDRLYLFYLDVLNIKERRFCDFYRTESSDIENWGKPVLIRRFELSSNGTEHYLCPAFVAYEREVFFFAVHWKREYESSLIYTSSESFDFNKDFMELKITGMPEDYYLWHINICYFTDGAKNHKNGESKKLLGVFLLRKKSSNAEYKTVIAVSAKAGADWQVTDIVKPPNAISSDCAALYKGAVIPYSKDADEIQLVMSYRDKNHVWKLCSFPQKMGDSNEV